MRPTENKPNPLATLQTIANIIGEDVAQSLQDGLDETVDPYDLELLYEIANACERFVARRKVTRVR